MKITIKDIDVSYIKRGNSDNKILLLHGWGCNKEIFAGLINYLSSFMEVYAIDFPGFGKTKEPDTVWDVDAYTDLVEEFIKQLGIKKITLLGHSFGGRVIIKLCSRKLDFLIEKIVLVDAAGIRHEVSSSGVKRLSKNILPVAKKISPKFINFLKSKIGSSDYKSASPKMRDIMVKVINEDLTKYIDNINCPTLIIWGDQDTETPYQDAVYMNEHIKDSGIVKVEGGTHFAFLEQPYLVNAVLKNFLSEDK